MLDAFGLYNRTLIVVANPWNFGNHPNIRPFKNIFPSDARPLENERRVHRTRGNNNELSRLDEANVLRRGLVYSFIKHIFDARRDSISMYCA